MIVRLTQGTIGLTTGELISLPHADGLTIKVTEGRVWLTQEGHKQDLWLERERSLRIIGPGRVVIEAGSRACIRISPVLQTRKALPFGLRWPALADVLQIPVRAALAR